MIACAAPRTGISHAAVLSRFPLPASPAKKEGEARKEEGAAIDDCLRRAARYYAETVFDRSAKLLRSFASLGGITAMQ